jgi:hypothetical protein
MKYIPITPMNTRLLWLVADTEEKAWKNLENSGGRLPYPPTKEQFIKRGYTVEPLTEKESGL